MPYSLVSAATLGFDLVRLPSGHETAEVLLAGLGAGVAKLWNAARGRMSPRARPPGTTA